MVKDAIESCLYWKKLQNTPKFSLYFFVRISNWDICMYVMFLQDH